MGKLKLLFSQNEVFVFTEHQTSEAGTLEDFWTIFDASESFSLGFFIKDRRAILQTLEVEGE